MVNNASSGEYAKGEYDDIRYQSEVEDGVIMRNSGEKLIVN
jgi:hypothetical protein